MGNAARATDQLVEEMKEGTSLTRLYAGLLLKALKGEHATVEDIEIEEEHSPQWYARQALMHHHQLFNAWEQDFLAGISEWKGNLSEKQEARLRVIMRKI